MRTKKLATIFFTTAFLAACASPRVTVDRVDGPDLEGKTKFKMPHSMVVFSFVKNKDGEATDKIGVASVPTTKDDQVYAIDGTYWYQNWGVATRLNATSRENPLLLDSVGVEVEDNRVAILTTLGSIATTLIPFALKSQADKPNLPTGIDVSEFLANSKTNCKEEDPDLALSCDVALAAAPGSYTWRAGIEIDAAPKSSIPIEEIDWPLNGDVLVYPACREMKLTVTAMQAGVPLPPFSTVLYVSDPSRLETVRLPQKGKVVMKLPCGVNVTSEKAAVSNELDVLKELLTQAAAVRKALKGEDGTAK